MNKEYHRAEAYLDARFNLTKCLYARMMPNGFYAPCGHCSYCRKQYARELAFRCEQEAYDKYCYNVLLTYDDEHLPYHNDRPCLNRVHVQDFLKRFRTWHDKHTGTKLRFFGVGEYGGKKGRPHYHLIFFTDKPLESRHDDFGEPLSFVQGILVDKWRHGSADIEPMKNVGSSVRYFVQYLLTYDREDKTFVKPFRMMSRGKGLGHRWLERTRPFQRYAIETGDHTVSRTNSDGKKITLSVPRYYKRKYVPEELLIANADQYYYDGQQVLTLFNNLTTNEREELKGRIRIAQEREREHQRDLYRQRKVHENNRSACRLFARTAKGRKGQSL